MTPTVETLPRCRPSRTSSATTSFTCPAPRAKRVVSRHPLFWPALWGAMIAALVGCGPVRLVSPYDEALDHGASEIHTRIVAFLDKMTTVAGKPEGTYAANTTFYSDLKASVATLKMRAQAQGKNEVTVALVGELGTNVENLRRLHESSKDAGLPAVLASPALSAIEVNCAAIVKFEVAKRRGIHE
jgi:hypothetical protein